MKKEEALKVFRSYKIWDLMDSFTTDELQEMIDEIVSTTSLPSDIDEAAKQIVIQKHPCMEDCLILDDRLTRGELIALVKAGVEWLAGQYEKIEGDLVDWYSTSEGKDYCCGVKTDEAFEVPEGFYIRKKQ